MKTALDILGDRVNELEAAVARQSDSWLCQHNEIMRRAADCGIRDFGPMTLERLGYACQDARFVIAGLMSSRINGRPMNRTRLIKLMERGRKAIDAQPEHDRGKMWKFFYDRSL